MSTSSTERTPPTADGPPPTAIRPRTARVAALSVVVLLALAGLSVVLVPAWDEPGPVTQVAPAPSAVPAPSDPVEAERSEVTVRSRDADLAATVLVPRSDGPHPAVVLVGGAGPVPRTALLAEAEEFAAAGVAALVYDKSLAGYSEIQRDYSALADDALAAAAVLAAVPGVDPDRLGMWGTSEGGWILPIAANRSPGLVDFLVLASAPVVSPIEQSAWTVLTALRDAGAPPGAVRLAVTSLGSGRTINPYSTYETRPELARLTQPVLAVYGSSDPVVPTFDSATRLLAATDGRVTVRSVAGADHGLRVGGSIAPEVSSAVADWIRGQPASATPPTGREWTGAPSEQRYGTPDVPQTPVWLSLPVRLLAAVLVIGGFTVTLVATRRRSVSGADGIAPDGGVRSALRRLAVTGIVTHVAPLLFLGAAAAVILTGTPGWAVTLLWVLVRLLAVATVVLAVDAADRVVSATRLAAAPRRLRIAVGGASVATAVGLLFATAAGLFAATP